MRQYFAKAYDVIKEQYWKDPVWSKVISAGIITVLGSILTTIYLFIKTIAKKITFQQSFHHLLLFLNESSSVNNFIIICCCVLIAVSSISFLIKLIKDIKKKKKIVNEHLEEELPLVPLQSFEFFTYRLASAFPGQRGLVWYDDPKKITERLKIFFQKPIKFRSDMRERFSSTPIWWLRDMSSMYIDHFEKLSKTKILLGVKELELKRMAVNIDQAYYKCFIYLEAKGEKQTGLYDIDETNIKSNIEHFGYSWEEYGLFKNIPILREEYEDGAAIIKGKVVDTAGAQLRTRFLSDYNFILVPHDSPFNSQRFARESGKYLNEVIMGKMEVERFFDFLDSFRKREV